MTTEPHSQASECQRSVCVGFISRLLRRRAHPHETIGTGVMRFFLGGDAAGAAACAGATGMGAMRRFLVVRCSNGSSSGAQRPWATGSGSHS